MANDIPQMKCPHCDYDLFESGVMVRVKDATITREIEFGRQGLTIHGPQTTENSPKTVSCKHCKRHLSITFEQLDDVFSGRRTEADMTAECGWTERPIYRCANCGVDMLKGGFLERTTGMENINRYTFGAKGPQIEIIEDTEVLIRYLECSMCGGRTEIPASVLMEYYHGEISLEDINGE